MIEVALKIDPTTSKKPSAEDSFRGALEDTETIVQALAPLCHDFDELLGMVKHGLENEAQLRLLYKVVTGKAAG